MTDWSSHEPTTTGEVEETRSRPRPSDGTSNEPVTICAVHHGGDLYIRSVDGPAAAWFRGVCTSR
ncbi:DUF2255 family protein [Pseudonocardia spinosispora]|uniref:DUF2255 family protein n=1 Tax=Pseudonocardia spinosispora TaxID=103441 RepID=UPI00146FC856